MIGGRSFEAGAILVHLPLGFSHETSQRESLPLRPPERHPEPEQRDVIADEMRAADDAGVLEIFGDKLPMIEQRRSKGAARLPTKRLGARQKRVGRAQMQRAQRSLERRAPMDSRAARVFSHEPM